MKQFYLSGVIGALLLASFSFAASGMESDITSRIIGGDKSKLNAWPFMVALTRPNKNDALCGGSFLGDRYVLTAAHCVQGLKPTDAEVVIGAYDMNNLSPAERVSIKHIYLHKNYQISSKAQGDDIAILELTRALGKSRIELANLNHFEELKAGFGLTAIGFGYRQYDPTRREGSDSSPVLHQVEVPFVPLTQCKNLPGSYQNLGEGVFCAGETGKDTCMGDSGGPIIFDTNDGPRQMGIVSWGRGCGIYPGVYTKVSHYSDWISDHTKGLSYRQSEDLGIIKLGNYFHTFTLTNHSDNTIRLNNPKVTVDGMELGYIDSSQDQCSGDLEPGAECNIQISYLIPRFKQGRVQLEFDSDDFREGKVAAWLDYHALQDAPQEVTDYLSTLPGHKAYDNGNVWQVSGDNLRSTSSLEKDQVSELVLEGLPRGELTFNYRVHSHEFLDSLTIYVNGKESQTMRGGNLGDIFNRGSHSIEMYNQSNIVRLVYHRHQYSNESDSHVSVTDIKHQKLTYDLLRETLDLMRANNNSKRGGGSIDFGAAFLLLLLVWIRRSRHH
ncbi:S1 family peptidase [Photobacterium sp. 53610]|uniref:S1 family peptidase n=1 Tax=Photobacterium sp. 53610 TaxID=3102789 RepID=UPI002ED82067